MQVETFECVETKNEHPEICLEAVEIIEKLGLEGQQAMVSKKPGLRGVRCPYRIMTDDEKSVYRQLCPKTTELKRFALEPIPIRVLQVAAHADSLGFFKHLEVWHREQAAVNDPVLVGVRQDDEHTWRDTYWILARWGDALDEWPAMCAQAIRSWKEKAAEKLNEIITSATVDLQRIESAGLAAVGRGLPSYNFVVTD